MFVFIAGASSTGAFVARYSELRKSSAMPLANLPMTLAVHGATSSSAMPIGDRDVLDVGVHPRLPLRRDDRTPRDRLERHRPDEPRRRARHDRDDVVAALLQPAAHFDRLVGADAAGHAESDQGHDQLPSANCRLRDAHRRLPGSRSWALAVTCSSSIFSTLRRSTSRWAIVIFFSPVSRGTAPASSCRARWPARTTNSNRFSFGALSSDSFHEA